MRWVLPWVLVACGGPASLQPSELAQPESWSSADPGPAPLRRLTRSQYEHILVDVFGDALEVPPLDEPDVALGGLVALGASTTTYSPRGVESLESAAFAVARQVVDAPALRARVLDCSPTGWDEACARQVLDGVGRRLWRRTLDDDESARLFAVGEAATTALGSFDEGVAYMLATLLQSPSFLYRAELAEDGALSGEAFASRLAFFLWDAGPDVWLLEAGASGSLDTPDGLFEAVERMLDDPRARRGLRTYATDHLQLADLDELRKDPTQFPHYAPELGPDAREETLRVFEYFALDADLDLRDLLVTPETFLNPRLASLYGIPSPVDAGWKRVTLPVSSGRAGLLGHASFLANHAHPTSSSVTLRGKAVRNLLLCQEIPAAPVDVDTSIPEPSGEAPTLRDRVAEHLDNAACASCHRLTDPIGIGLENYDSVGRYRTHDNGVQIDPTGNLDGISFLDPRGVGAAIRAHGAFERCLVRTVTRYAIGRHETEAEEAWMTTLDERFAAHGYRMRPFLHELVQSPLFRRASAEEAE
jgi:hypothetical protein